MKCQRPSDELATALYAMERLELQALAAFEVMERVNASPGVDKVEAVLAEN